MDGVGVVQLLLAQHNALVILESRPMPNSFDEAKSSNRRSRRSREGDRGQRAGLGEGTD